MRLDAKNSLSTAKRPISHMRGVHETDIRREYCSQQSAMLRRW